MSTRLAKADAAQRANVKPCRSAYCRGRYRVRGLEYDTGGCLDYDTALRISRKMDEVGGPDEWRRIYGRRFSG
jgi:hypothetical protein